MSARPPMFAAYRLVLVLLSCVLGSSVAAQQRGPAAPTPGDPVAANPDSPRPAEEPTKPEATKPEAPKAEAEPSPATPPATEEPAEEHRGPSYSRLAEPELAQRVQLTEQQRSRISALLAERAQRLARVPAAERYRVIQDFEQRLSRILTPAQREQWSQLNIEPKLRFNFRYQRWIDVLQWFAEQADLSLVLEAPPPGTFNYTDSREYTPTEAIDLLNGVLLTKGYTLVRRGRMLLVVDLKDGLPEGLVPRVDLKELEKRGKYELVTVQFPLGRRLPSTVVAEIKPLLGPHGKIVTLPATQQVLVTDTAGVMRSIQAIIQSMPEPEAAAAVPAGPLVLANYPIRPADPKVALRVITTLAPTAKVVVDEKADQLHVHATAAEQTLIQKVLDDMRAANPPEKQAQIEVYPVAETAAAATLEAVKMALPEARVTLDSSANKLVVWATPAEQAAVKKIIEKLDAAGAPGRTRQLDVYRLTRVDPATTLLLLQRILPDARLALDPQTRMLVALAVPADHQVIKTTLQTLQPDKPGVDAPEMRFYPLALGLPPEALAVLKRSVPEATVAIDATADRLIAVATPAEHERLKNAIERMEKLIGLEGRSKLVIYPVTAAERKRFLAVFNSLRSQAVGIQLITDAEPGELAVWAKPHQHDMVVEMLKELRREVPPEERFQLVGYPVTAGDPANVLSILQSLFPSTKLLLDSKSNRILAWTKPAEQEAIKASLEQIAQQGGEGASRFEVYDTRGAGGYTLINALLPLVPGAKLSTDPKTGNLVAWAAPAEHERLKAAVAKLVRGGPAADEGATIEVYRLSKADPATTLKLLLGLVPEAKLSVDPQTRSLVALALPADQQRIRETLDRLQPAQPDPDAPLLELYALKQAPPASLLQVLKNAAPRATIVLEPDGRRLTALASPDDQRLIQSLLDRLEKAAPQEPRKLTAYPLKSADPKGIADVLTGMFPDAQFIPDQRSGRLAVLATAADQEAIKAAIAELDSGPPADGPEKVMSYQVGRYSTALALEVLRELLPNARFQTDKLGTIVAWARPKEHETIKKVLDDLSGENAPEKKPTLEVYPIDATGGYRLLGTLQPMVPAAKLSLDSQAGTLVVWGTAKDHETVQGAIAKLGLGGAAQGARQLEVYRLTKADPAAAMSLLQTLVPGARLASDPRTQSLIAVATAADQKIIRGTLEQLQPETPGPNDPELRFYALKGADPTSVLNMLQTVFPEARCVLDRRTGQLAVWARPADQEAIKKAVAGMDTGVPAAEGPEKVMSYEVTRGSTTLALEVLRELLPAVRFQGDKLGTIVAWARPKEHETIKQVLADLSGENAPERKLTLEIYPIDTTGGYRLLGTLQPMVPAAKLSLDPQASTLAVWGTAKDHDTIQGAITKLGIGGAAQGARQLEVHRLTKADPTATLALLQTLVPAARLAVDPRTQSLIAVASLSDQKIIRSTLEQLQPKTPGPNDPELRIYPIRSADPDSLVAAAGKLYPSAELLVDRRGRRIIAMARRDEQPGIQELLEKLDAGAPADAEETLVVYPVQKGDAKTVASMLQQLFPDMQFGADYRSATVMARGRKADQQGLAKVIGQLNEPDEQNRPRVAAYAAGNADPFNLRAMLARLVPNATVAADPKTRTIVAAATAREHELIRDAVEKVAKGGEGNAFKAATYAIEAATPAAALAVLRQAAPGAILAEGADPRQIVAWASEEDHKTIQQIVAQMAKQGPDENAPTMAVYNLRSGVAMGFVMALRVILPEARCGVGSNPRQLVVFARPADQARIREIVEKMSEREPAETAPQIKAYTLRTAGAVGVMKALAAALPEAQFAVGAESSQLIAFARPADQAIIKAAVEQIEAEGLADVRRVLTVYPIKANDAAALLQVLDPKLLADARVVADPTRDGLIVWAEPRQQEAVKSAVDQFVKQMPKALEPTAQVYRFRRADPKAAQMAIAKLVPNAQIGLDVVNRALIVSALPDDHQKLGQAVRQLDEETENAPKLRMHRLSTAEAASLLLVLQGLFKQRTDVQLAVDAKNDAIIAVAPPADHETIRTLIEQVEKALPEDAQAKLQLYALKDIDSTTALEVITKVLEKLGGKAQLSVEPYSNQLVAIARPEQHALIRETLERLKSDERHLEIIQLENLEPNTAILAIRRLFTGERLNSPEVDSDPTTQQLFIRGSKEQIAQIRQLLIKLGETGLAVVPRGGGPIRTIPFQGDLKEAIQELQRIWPQLRENPLRVVPASAISPLLRRQRDQEGPPAPPEPKQQPGEGTKQEPSKPSKPSAESSPSSFVPRPLPLGFVAVADDSPPPAEEPKPGDAATAQPKPGDSPQAEPKPAASKPGAPILIAVGEGSVTIASDDLEALDYFESLLRALSQRTGAPGRNFAVYTLRHTSAARVAATLQQIFRTTQPGATQPGSTARTAASSVVIVPDERLNAVLVQAGRTDRATIENLIKVLDSAELPAAAERKPRTIAVKNTKAARIEQMIRGMFRAELAGSGGSSRSGTAGGSASGPSWLATEIVVDEVTNSLIVTGPAPLVEHIEQFARSLDEAAGEDASREFIIVPLKKTNAARVQQVLEAVLGQRLSSPAATSRTPAAATSPARKPSSPAPRPRPTTPAAPAEKTY